MRNPVAKHQRANRGGAHRDRKNEYQRMSSRELLRAVDRSNPEVAALAERLEDEIAPAIELDSLRNAGL